MSSPVLSLNPPDQSQQCSPPAPRKLSLDDCLLDYLQDEVEEEVLVAPPNPSPVPVDPESGIYFGEEPGEGGHNTGLKSLTLNPRSTSGHLETRCEGFSLVSLFLSTESASGPIQSIGRDVCALFVVPSFRIQNRMN